MIRLMDPAAQYHELRDEIDIAVAKVLAEGRYILGPNVAALEEEVAAYVGASHGVGVASGTDALVLTLRALGIGPGDEVIVPAYTFFATAGAVLLVGATPVLVDVDARTYCIDVDRLGAALTPRTRAVVPVHLYGHPVEIKSLADVLSGRDVFVVEDAAQAVGSSYGGAKVGSLGIAAAVSFFPTKNLGGCGDGGMVLTSDDDVAAALRRLRTHGWQVKYHPETIGYNSRLDEIQAAILRVKLRRLDLWNERRRVLAARYADLLKGLDLVLPAESPNAVHVYHLYVIRTIERDRLRAALTENGIENAVYYPQPLHFTDVFRARGIAAGSFPAAEQASRETLAIPLYPELTEQEQERVAGVIRRVLS